MQSTRTLTINRNNLDKSSSPYLLQHTENPVWWQEWSDDLLQYAVKINKPLLVSVGYATCHWCHVMAAEAFSDKNTAEYLNDHFICIKVDREQRPDIDQYMMDFINQQNGRGGWPLNVFLTPTLHPVFALTYAPLVSRDSVFSFMSVAEKVFEYFENNTGKIPPFASVENQSPIADEQTLIMKLSEYYDLANGGFGTGQKFPSHSTILYLLYQPGISDSPSIKTIVTKTLDEMRLNGLNDHLQGGIFRYCIDNEWTIPYFEKMLYDQAMALWVYSLAYKVIGDSEYKKMAEKISKCLEESFKTGGFYISAHDADTGHKEGATYLWSYEELIEELNPDEFRRFSETYYISKSGNFEGLNHLIKRNDTVLDSTESKLLLIRKSRRQPSSDDKILCGINSLLAVCMIQSGRLLGKPSLEESASILVQNIIVRFWDGKTLSHSFYNGILQKQGFLFDAAALLTAISILYERDASWRNIMDALVNYVESFREGEKWTESHTEDFQKVYASWFDQPIPSSVSLATMGLARAALLTGNEIKPLEYRHPFQSDFYNLTAMIHNGLFHIYTTEKLMDCDLLPVNSIQLRGEPEQDCFMGTCSPLNKQQNH